MAVPKPQRGGPMAAQLMEEFGINSAVWTRLRYVYERHLCGDQRATYLIELIDQGVETPAKAKRLLQQALDDDDQVGNMASVKLADLFQQALHFNSFIATVGAGLRRGVRLNKGHMSDDEIAELLSLLEKLGTNTTRVADLLTRATTGGSTAHDR